MHLVSLRVTGLFGQFNHFIRFPSPDDNDSRPSLVILHGPNGVGKTTLLRMLDGLMRLDFNAFRHVPLSSCELAFSTGDAIYARPVEPEHSTSARGRHRAIEVAFREHRVLLSGTQPGALREEDSAAVEEFRQSFFATTEDLTFDYIDTERLVRAPLSDADLVLNPDLRLTAEEYDALMARQVRSSYRRQTNPKAREPRGQEELAAKVRRFVREAQINYRTFFASREPDLFPRILQHLTDTEHATYEASDLLQRLTSIRDKEKAIARFGLETEPWDYESLARFLTTATTRAGYDPALSALGAYVEVLESRSAQQALVAERLITFEDLMKSFFIAKHVNVDSRMGLRIVTKGGTVLVEDQLSSGEYHLLYLMVAALTTRRRGTIIAIDEPELSMHISWQRRLVRALVECASGAEPQFLFATHSPDIAADYPESMVRLAPDWDV